jgi:hypothetical protein
MLNFRWLGLVLGIGSMAWAAGRATGPMAEAAAAIAAPPSKERRVIEVMECLPFEKTVSIAGPAGDSRLPA